jgi:cephalosporin hydroxylase
LFCKLAEITGTSPAAHKGYYDELGSLGVFAEVEQILRETTTEGVRIDRVGIEKYVRLDRTALYCLVRATKPGIFIETGTRWGLGSFFILRAMQENGKGHLFSFDLGVEASRRDYAWPANQTRLGFVVPDRLRSLLTIVEGDSLRTLPETLPRLPPVDVFYHDSLHTREHMLGEYTIVFPRMRKGGVFMSEDTHMTDAWDLFVADKVFVATTVYYSHLGIFGDREISAIRLPS